MNRVQDNESFVRLAQGELGVNVDGWAGEITTDAFMRSLQSPEMPASDPRSLEAYYGKPGPEVIGQLEYFTSPYVMYYADRPVSRIRCHRLVKPSLFCILSDLLVEFGPDGIEHHGLDQFGGCYNHRKQRGGKQLSTHSYGAAIDLDPVRNGNLVPWPHADRSLISAVSERYLKKTGKTPPMATMPLRAVEIFESYGWRHGGRSWGRDAMHFQRTL